MVSISMFNKTELALLNLLRFSLRPTGGVPSLPSLTGQEWERVLILADRHEVLPLLETVLEEDGLPEAQRLAIQWKTAKTVHESIQLQGLNARLTALLKKAGITAVTLKGFAVARFYPVPEFRKTTDIDLFVPNRENWKRAVRILRANGFQAAKAWHANHHAVLTAEKRVVEVHSTWTESFQDKHLNRYLEKLQKESDQHCRLVDCQGIQVYAYDAAWQGFYLLLHMLMHFLGSGFGLRNLCDWVVLWEHCDDAKERETFWKLACESGASEFAKAVTSICLSYLGLTREKSPVPAGTVTEQEITDALLRDVLDAGEFGYSEAERMVGMDGSSLGAYLREFHHQMHINFPKAGRMILLWPFLWCVTLARFLKNNKKLNRPPVSAILKKAGRRGELVSRLTTRGV